MDEPKVEDDEENIIKNKDNLKINHKKQIQNRKHYLNTEKKFNCDKCSFSGKFISNLKVHIESVHDSITHPCDNCGQRFSQRSALFSHKRRVHEGVRFPCEFCDYSASENYKLKVHKANKHAE